MKVRELMTPEPITATVPGTRADVLQLLGEHEVSGLPVIREDTRKLVGVVTRTDVMRNPDDEQLATIMTQDPVTVEADDDILVAARIFFERRIHTLPVLDGGELVGVLSPSDLLRVLAERNGREVASIVTERVVPVHQGTPARVAWEIRRVVRHNALPVLDDDARLVGIVSDSDLFRASGVEETVHLENAEFDVDDEHVDAVKDRSPAASAERRLAIPASTTVADLMVRDVVTVFERSSVSDAAKKMLSKKVSQLPVVDSMDLLVGIVTDFDLLQMILTPSATRAQLATPA